MLVFRKILRTYLMNDPNVQHSTQNNILEQGKVAEQDML